jgi:hypothetical protein
LFISTGTDQEAGQGAANPRNEVVGFLFGGKDGRAGC